MTEAKRDANWKTVGLAASSADPTVTLPLPIEPLTGYVQVDLTVDLTLPATLDPSGKRDGNHRPCFFAVTDDANEDIVPISTDIDGNLLVELE